MHLCLLAYRFNTNSAGCSRPLASAPDRAAIECVRILQNSDEDFRHKIAAVLADAPPLGSESTLRLHRITVSIRSQRRRDTRLPDIFERSSVLSMHHLIAFHQYSRSRVKVYFQSRLLPASVDYRRPERSPQRSGDKMTGLTTTECNVNKGFPCFLSTSVQNRRLCRQLQPRYPPLRDRL